MAEQPPEPRQSRAYITQEAQALRVENPVNDTRDFQTVQARLGQMAPAPSDRRSGAPRQHRQPAIDRDQWCPADRTRGRAVHARYNTYDEGGIFRVSVPSNWREMPSESQVTFAPDGGHGTINNTNVFTHGIQIGMARNEQHDLQEATDELLAGLRNRTAA